jgi:hypothetical protein
MCFARSSNSGLIVTGSAAALGHRNQIIGLAARYRLPTIFPGRVWAAEGGLVSYGPDQIDPYRRAAEYVDRILKGERPGDLPVQAPIKFELVINLRTAKAMGITMPPSVLARADGVVVENHNDGVLYRDSDQPLNELHQVSSPRERVALLHVYEVKEVCDVRLQNLHVERPTALHVTSWCRRLASQC